MPKFYKKIFPFFWGGEGALVGVGDDGEAPRLLRLR